MTNPPMTNPPPTTPPPTEPPAQLPPVPAVDAPAVQAPAVDAPAAPRACQNCGAPLLGEHCYACGQPVKGLVRHFSSILGDFFDTVFNIDSRVFRTLWPLFAKPAYLSNEYFAGRRVRYVSPVRLFFFLSIITFFVAQFAVDFGDNQLQFNGRDDDMARATTVAEVERVRDAALKELDQARDDIPAHVPGARAGVDAGATAVRNRAAKRIAELQRATAQGVPVPPAKNDDEVDLNLFSDQPWDAKTNPIDFKALPDFANDWLNEQAQHTKDNIKRYQENPNQFKDAVLSAVPSTLFLLLPVFALMLKLAYAFKRRLYMEHLIVALHSHAFLCLALLLQFALAALERGLAPTPGALRSGFNLLQAALWTWMPLYLLLMQKRVYGQGWPMTLLKYFVLGICYVTLLSIGAAFTMLASLVWT